MEIIPQALAAVSVLVGLPWLLLHYITRWKTAATLTGADEKLIEELYDLARRLDERVATVERIMTVDNPNWRAIGCDPAAAIEDSSRDSESIRRIK